MYIADLPAVEKIDSQDISTPHISMESAFFKPAKTSVAVGPTEERRVFLRQTGPPETRDPTVGRGCSPRAFRN